MDSRDLINIDDLVQQRLSGGVEQELPGAWPRMLHLLEKEDKKRPFAFFYWGRGVYIGSAMLLLALLTAGGLHYSSVLDGFRNGYGSGPVASIAASNSPSSKHHATSAATNTASTTTANSDRTGGADSKAATVDAATAKSNSTAAGPLAAATPVFHRHQHHGNKHIAARNASGANKVGGNPMSANGDNYTVAAHRNKKGGVSTGFITNNQPTPPTATGTRPAATPSSSPAAHNDASVANTPETTTRTATVNETAPATLAATGNNTAITARLSKPANNNGKKGHSPLTTTSNMSTAGNNVAPATQSSAATGATNALTHTSHIANRKSATSFNPQHPVLAAGQPANVPSTSVVTSQQPGTTNYDVTGKRNHRRRTEDRAASVSEDAVATNVPTVGAGNSVPKANTPAAATSTTLVASAPDEATVKAKKPVRMKTHSKYELQTKSKLDHNGTVVYQQDTIDVTVDSFIVADNEGAEENNSALAATPKPVTSAQRKPASSNPLRHLASATPKTRRMTGLNDDATITGKKGAKPTARRTATKTTTNADEATESDNSGIAMAILHLIRPAIIYPQATMSKIALVETATKTEAKKKKGGHTWENISNAFNDIKFNLSHAEFSKGVTAGLNATFFGANSFKGFQFGVMGSFLFNEKWSATGELKYFHRMTGTYAIRDFYAPNATDSIVNSFYFSTLHSFEMPWALKYTYKNWSFIGGANFLYALGVNTGAAALPYQRVNTAAPISQSAPSINEADFSGRFGLGYLLGFNVKLSPNVNLDVRNVQTFWDNAQSSGAKSVSSQLYKSPSMQFSIQYMFGRNKD
ncbi:MAG: hypothetical protein EBZ77_00605 [Chitinophagia bacterium]|nr:hypothetical protein [Chitinophagia bacterium]